MPRQKHSVILWLAVVSTIWMGWGAPPVFAVSIVVDHVGSWFDGSEPDPDKRMKWHYVVLAVTDWGIGPDPPGVFQLDGLLFEKGINAGVGTAFDNKMFPPNMGYATSTNNGEHFRVDFDQPITLPLMHPVNLESLGIMVSTHLDLLAADQVDGFFLDTQGNKFLGKIVPEVTTFTLGGLGALALSGYARRRRI